MEAPHISAAILGSSTCISCVDQSHIASWRAVVWFNFMARPTKDFIYTKFWSSGGGNKRAQTLYKYIPLVSNFSWLRVLVLVVVLIVHQGDHTTPHD